MLPGGAAAEVVSGAVKAGRKGSRSPWLILESALGGSEPDAVLWREYAQGTKGARQLTGLSPLARLYEVEAAEVEARELVRVAMSQRTGAGFEVPAALGVAGCVLGGGCRW